MDELSKAGYLQIIQIYVYSDVMKFKSLEFRGTSLSDLCAFPIRVRREAGYQLDQIQNGKDPVDWKPMESVGQGVKEIRIRDVNGAYRIIYVAKFEEAVFVLHCFSKKSQKTGRTDLDLAARRYRDLKSEMHR